MNFLFESVDFTDAKLNAYEEYESGNITESEKDDILNTITSQQINTELLFAEAAASVSSILKYSGLVAIGAAICGAISLMIGKIRISIDTKDKIKASKELTEIKNEIAKSQKKLASLKSEYAQIYNAYYQDSYDARQRANYYGTRTTREVSTQRELGTNDTKTVVTYAKNKEYDREKAEAEAKKAKELEATSKKYDKLCDETKEEIKNMKELKSRFLAMVRQNASAEEYETIKAELEKISAQADADMVKALDDPSRRQLFVNF